jgi:predicted RNA-binding protein with RPS1 domain
LSGNGFDDVHDPIRRRAEFLRALSPRDTVWGRVRNIVDYGAFIDLGCLDGLLHVSGVPAVVNGMIGEKLTEGDEIEVEVLAIDIESQRITHRIPMYYTDGKGPERSNATMIFGHSQ